MVASIARSQVIWRTTASVGNDEVDPGRLSEELSRIRLHGRRITHIKRSRNDRSTPCHTLCGDLRE